MNWNRRTLVVNSLKALTVAPLLFVGQQVARAADKVYKKADLATSKKNPAITGLKYVDDATKAKRTDRMGVAADKQSCATCNFYKEPGKIEGTKDEVGKCIMLQNQLVHGKGWCNVWSKKA